MKLKTKLPPHRGFTLIEFVVIITIFSIMAGIALFNFRGFQADIGVTNLAHDIAVTLKKVQTESGGALSDEEYFETTQDVRPLWTGIVFPYESGVYIGEFSVFSDVNNDTQFSERDLVLDTVRIQSGDFIEKIQYQTGTSTSWNDASGAVSILFRRPFPEVGAWSVPDTSSRVRIVLSSADGEQKRAVVVSKIGAISVEFIEEE